MPPPLPSAMSSECKRNRCALRGNAWRTGTGTGTRGGMPFDPLLRMGQLQQHLLRTSAVSDTAYEPFCTRLFGCVVEERPLPSEHSGRGGGGSNGSWRVESPPFRRATVTNLRTATPLKLVLHTLGKQAFGLHLVALAVAVLGSEANAGIAFDLVVVVRHRQTAFVDGFQILGG